MTDGIVLQYSIIHNLRIQFVSAQTESDSKETSIDI
jgi:hypothetical protein